MLEKRLLKLIYKAADGYYWMYGHQDKIWYRHDGFRWIEDTPDPTKTLHKSDRSQETASDTELEEQLAQEAIFALLLIVLVGLIVYLSTG